MLTRSEMCRILEVDETFLKTQYARGIWPIEVAAVRPRGTHKRYFEFEALWAMLSMELAGTFALERAVAGRIIGSAKTKFYSHADEIEATDQHSPGADDFFLGRLNAVGPVETMVAPFSTIAESMTRLHESFELRTSLFVNVSSAVRLMRARAKCTGIEIEPLRRPPLDPSVGLRAGQLPPFVGPDS